MADEFTPFLSIIVPIYNGEKYLRSCIESILNQEYNDFELILVNDGSKDDSLRICRAYAHKDFRIQVLSQDNKGSIAARKEGIKTAKGQYIGFVDSDDWIQPTMYEQLCQKAVQYSADIVVCDFVASYKNKEIETTQGIAGGFYDKKRLCKEVYSTMLCNSVKNSFYNILPAYWNKIFRKEVIYQYLLQLDERIKLGEDMVCVYPSLWKAKNLYYLKNHYLYYYRQRNNSMSREHTSQYLKNFSILVDSLKKDIDYDMGFIVQVAGFVCHKVEDAIELGVTCNSIGKFIKEFKNDYLYSGLRDIVRGYDKRHLSCFQKVKFFFLDKEMYTMLFILCKIKYVIKRKFKCTDSENVYECYE